MKIGELLEFGYTQSKSEKNKLQHNVFMEPQSVFL
jgi:hypothetical protein